MVVDSGENDESEIGVSMVSNQEKREEGDGWMDVCTVCREWMTVWVQ